MSTFSINFLYFDSTILLFNQIKKAAFTTRDLMQLKRQLVVLNSFVLVFKRI